jgi:hypothetical protein
MATLSLPPLGARFDPAGKRSPNRLPSSELIASAINSPKTETL